MEYRTIADVKRPVSRIVFGTAIPAMMRGENVNKLLDAVFAAGVNTFDLARAYGLAERSFGEWMAAKNNRNKVIILTKGAHPLADSSLPRVTPEAIKEDIKTSLKMLKTDFIDIYMLHRDDPKVPVGPLVETLNELREAGKIGVFGGSNWNYSRIDAANEYAYAHDMFGFDVSSPGYSLAERIEDPWGGGCIDLSGEKQKGERAWYQGKGIEVFAYSGLAHGFFSGKFTSESPERAKKVLDEFAVKGYCCPENFKRLKRTEELARKKNATVPQIALAWLLGQPIQPMAVCSASIEKRMVSNIKSMKVKLTEEEIRWLSEGT